MKRKFLAIMFVFVFGCLDGFGQSSAKPNKVEKTILTAPEQKQTEIPYETAIFEVKAYADKIALMSDLESSSLQLARIADLLWTHDELYARELFGRALMRTSIGQNE